MRHTSAVALLLLAGCGTAPRQASPEPQRHDSHPAPRIASLTVTDSAKRATIRGTRIEIVNACQTNDPMPTRHYGPSTLPPSLAIPNAQTLRPPAYIPNACPVTAGPLATQSVPAVNSRRPKVIPQAEPRDETPGQP